MFLRKQHEIDQIPCAERLILPSFCKCAMFVQWGEFNKGSTRGASSLPLKQWALLRSMVDFSHNCKKKKKSRYLGHNFSKVTSATLSSTSFLNSLRAAKVINLSNIGR